MRVKCYKLILILNNFPHQVKWHLLGTWWQTWINHPNSEFGCNTEVFKASELAACACHDCMSTGKLFIENHSFLSPSIILPLLPPHKPLKDSFLLKSELNTDKRNKIHWTGNVLVFIISTFPTSLSGQGLSFSPAFKVLGFLTCFFLTLMHCADGGSRELTRYLKVFAAIVPTRRWWLQAKDTGVTGSWPDLDDQHGAIALDHTLGIASAYFPRENSAVPYHQGFCYHASEAREQRFSGLLWDLNLVVINVALMLPCTSRVAFYPSLM